MIRDITLGQFYPSKSVIHELDPRTKIILTLAFIIQLFVVRGFLGFAIFRCAANTHDIAFKGATTLYPTGYEADIFHIDFHVPAKYVHVSWGDNI